MIDIINNYRISMGKPSVEVDSLQNTYCTKHCWAMAQHNDIYHTEEYLLNGWAEIVGTCSQYPEWKTVEECLIYTINSSEEHKRILLESDIIGYGIIAYKYKVYLTIRGKKYG